MAYPILGTPVPAFFDTAGDPLVGGTISILNPADDTVKASYPTADDANASTNGTSGDITLDSRGEPTSTQLWGRDNEDYKIVIKDSVGSTILTMDDIRMPTKSRRAAVTFTDTDDTPTVAESKNFILTGSTAITDFDDGVVGDVIHIKAAGGTQSLVITHATGLINLAGNSDFRMANNDSLTLAMFTDQVWTEVGRSISTGGPRFMTADDALVDTTLADVSELSTWLFPPGVYVAVEGFLKVISDADTQDIQFALQTDNAFQEGFWTYTNANDAGTTAHDSDTITTAMTVDIVTGTVHGVVIRGYFLTHASAARSTVDFQVAQGTDAGTTTLEKGSWIDMKIAGQ